MKRSAASVMLLLAPGIVACAPGRSRPRPMPAEDTVTIAPEPSLDVCAQAAAIPAPMRPIMPGPLSPRVGATVSRAVAPPPVSGGTLRVLADGVTAVASDPDRDQIYVVDLAAGRLARPPVMLSAGDEPGRLIEDAAGRVHVALRAGGAVVTLRPATGEILARRAVCAAPRGLAYEGGRDLVHVACAGGELVSLPAAGGDAVRRLDLGRSQDLRDVVVDGPRLRVSRFRAAEILTVEADGRVSARVTPPSVHAPQVRGGAAFTPSVAWRILALPASTDILMLHQRGLDEALPPPVGVGYYSGFDACGAIVHGALTIVAPDGSARSGPALAGLALAVDAAVSADGTRLAVIGAANATNAPDADTAPVLPRLFVTDLASATDGSVGCRTDGTHAPCMPSAPGPLLIPYQDEGDVPADVPPPICDVNGRGPDAGYLFERAAQPTAVAFDGRGRVIVQSREPAALIVDDGTVISLSDDSRLDTGHALFHANAGGHLACASCHPEGRDDGRVWHFTCGGARRTQSLQTGLAGTEPFHWDGHERDFAQLVDDVFVGRMSGPSMTQEESAATLHWLDAQPRVSSAPPTDLPAVARGRALFADSARAGCATCHAGAHLTNNQMADVGTGGALQVPSLVGLAAHAPFMHAGCAATLRDRFGACGGGDAHGVTSRLAPTELDDLVTYLEAL